MPKVRAVVAAIAFTCGISVAPWLVAEPARQASSKSPEFDVAVVSDLNQSYGSTSYGRGVHDAVSALTQRFRPGLVLITGDMVAGQKRGVDAPAMWRGFHATLTEPLERAGILIAPTPGNHDASPAFTEERAEYVRQWSARSSALSFVDASKYPLRYSFTYRGAFFLSLDAASVGPLSGEQRSWVAAQLDKASPHSLKIAFGHLPLYPIAHGREREILNDAALESLFHRHGVALYLSGHQHAYYPGATNDMRHVSMPCLGAGARPLLGTARPSRQALVLLHVEGNELTSVEALSAPDFTKTIQRSSLPARVAFGRHVLVRDDLAPPRRDGRSNDARQALR